MKMQCKCQYCKTSLNTQDAYVFMRRKSKKYFCNEDHYNLFVENKENLHKQREILNKQKEEILLLICEIFDVTYITNTILYKEWKEWDKIASNEVIKQYLEENKTFLHDSVSKINSNEFAKIRYLSAILKNNLSDYKKNETVVLEHTQSESSAQNTKIIYGLQAKYFDFNIFTNKYIDMYLNPSNKWDNSITLEDKISFILVANILNEDDIVRHITEMSYDDFLRTPYWKAISDYVKYKFNCVCRLCKNTNNLNVHHKIYDNHGYEHRIAVIETDLTVLCRDCHKKIHGIK